MLTAGKILGSYDMARAPRGTIEAIKEQDAREVYVDGVLKSLKESVKLQGRVAGKGRAGGGDNDNFRRAFAREHHDA